MHLSKIGVVRVNENETPVKMASEIPNSTAFWGSISGTTGLYFKNHLGIVCLNPEDFQAKAGGLAWRTDTLAQFKIEVAGYVPVDLVIQAFPQK
jgi:hypothetical protein